MHFTGSCGKLCYIIEKRTRKDALPCLNKLSISSSLGAASQA